MTPVNLRQAATVLVVLNLTVAVFALAGSAVLHHGPAAPELDYARLAAATARINILLGCSAALLLALTALGLRTTAWFLSVSVLVGGGSEWLSLATGFPFGHYTYTSLLGPTLWGLPVLIPLAWFMIAVPTVLLALRLCRRWFCALAVAAGLIVLWDLVLDPALTVGFAAWHWTAEGPYYGIPLQNFFGWALTALVLCALVLPVAARTPPDRSALPPALYLVQGLLPAGFALLHDRPGATIIWLLGMAILLVALYHNNRSATKGDRA